MIIAVIFIRISILKLGINVVLILWLALLMNLFLSHMQIKQICWPMTL